MNPTKVTVMYLDGKRVEVSDKGVLFGTTYQRLTKEEAANLVSWLKELGAK
jgi:hypothetical protein